MTGLTPLATPPPMPAATADVSWRPLAPSDAPAVHALVRAVEVADALPFVSTLEEIVQRLAEPELSLDHDSVGGWLADGRLACFGAATTHSGATRRRAVNQDGHVHPDWRRRGLGSAVVAWTETRGRQQLAAVADGVPGFLEVWCNRRATDRRALFESRGYEPIRYYDEMRRSLADELPDASLPDGLRIVRWEPELDDAFRVAHNTAFVDHWGSEPISAEQWRHNRSGSPYFRPDLTVAAVDDEGRIAGYVVGYHSPTDTEVTGRVEGWLGQVGTLREWRGKGVASGLMVIAMRAMAAAGMDHAVLEVDSENPTGAVGIYARLGFKPDQRWMRWAKPA